MTEEQEKICRLMGISRDEFEAARNSEQAAAMSRNLGEPAPEKIARLMGVGYGSARNQAETGKEIIFGEEVDPLKLAEAKAAVAKLMKLSPAEVTKREAETRKIAEATAPLTVEELAACWTLGITPLAYHSAKGVAAGLPPVVTGY
ncbi:hypothetical protein [Trichloromonas acetexigens]|uniref:Uncharacterized protein n=1 Tax=Trichloromonas acetexigens TaxID=38815 RepID=A0A550J2P0_9BACT|nr:hypothetical protein [Desulfuromonas acetexigens]TRO77517.1 hypothetical protein FL622_17170 [Desulfuromonas acetexigens]